MPPILYHVSYGQALKATQSLPSYQQIKPKNGEIIDYGGPNSTTQVVGVKPFTISDYPAGSVTYYLNGRPSTDVKYVKRVLADKGSVIESISISKPDQKGHRIIDINYKLP